MEPHNTDSRRTSVLRCEGERDDLSLSTVRDVLPGDDHLPRCYALLLPRSSVIFSESLLFHGKNGAVPLGNRSYLHDAYHPEPEPTPKSNPLAARAATISFSTFGPGGPFGFDAFHEKWKNQKKKAEPSKKKDHLSQGEGSPAGDEALGNEWLQNGNCPIAKTYRAVNRVLPLVAKAFEPPPGMKFLCPAAVVAARAALSKTELAKTLHPQPLPAKNLYTIEFIPFHLKHFIVTLIDNENDGLGRTKRYIALNRLVLKGRLAREINPLTSILHHEQKTVPHSIVFFSLDNLHQLQALSHYFSSDKFIGESNWSLVL